MAEIELKMTENKCEGCLCESCKYKDTADCEYTNLCQICAKEYITRGCPFYGARRDKDGRNKRGGISRIKDITIEIDFHENRIAMHKSALRRLRKEKSELMAKGFEVVKNGRK